MGDNGQNRPATGILSPAQNRWARLGPDDTETGDPYPDGRPDRRHGDHRVLEPARRDTSSPLKRETPKEISLDPGLIEKSMYTQAQQAMDEQQKALANMQKELARLKAEAAVQPPLPNDNPDRIPPPPVLTPVAAPSPAYSLPPPPAAFSNATDRTDMRGWIGQVSRSVPPLPPEDA